MKKMLVFIAVGGLVISVNSCASLEYSQPEFEKPFSYIIDSFQVRGTCNDYIILRNESSDSNIRFNVYIHDPRKNMWELVELGRLKGIGDTERLGSRHPKGLNKYRYFAVESLNEKSYRYVATKSGDDFHITVLDE
ncbi:MAG: hypothetical protein LBQ69_00505 [Treponema sp.]|jgi:hypothetical protein|nr:hypothetical protein [Treponema sp.]